MNQTLQCPACQSEIPVDLRLLARGASFQCPNATCRAAISVAGSSAATFSTALGRFESLGSLRAAKR
jgi:hypothetical protein